jgi:hypothetical protein
MTAAMLVLDPIFEADLAPEQYAYHPGGNRQWSRWERCVLEYARFVSHQSTNSIAGCDSARGDGRFWPFAALETRRPARPLSSRAEVGLPAETTAQHALTFTLELH